jgi:hypothetical protein
MHGGIVFKNDSPLGWLGGRQEHTSLSSCEAEIRATNPISKKVVDFRNLFCSVSDAGDSLPSLDAPTIIYNDNEACVRWSYNMTSKAARHIVPVDTFSVGVTVLLPLIFSETSLFWFPPKISS